MLIISPPEISAINILGNISSQLYLCMYWCMNIIEYKFCFYPNAEYDNILQTYIHHLMSYIKYFLHHHRDFCDHILSHYMDILKLIFSSPVERICCFCFSFSYLNWTFMKESIFPYLWNLCMWNSWDKKHQYYWSFVSK